MGVLKTLIFTVVVPGTVTVWIPYSLLPSRSEPFSVDFGVFRFLGLVPILLGALIYFWCAWDFTFTGRGTPAPIDPPKELVVRGLYRHVRNPMYVGVSLVIFGEFVLFEATILLVYAVLLLLGFHLFIVFYEEPTLRQKFGKLYDQYCQAVPRWIPNVKLLVRLRQTYWRMR